MLENDHIKPIGELVMRSVAMPGDTNANGDIFGGWVLSQMDLGGAVLAKTFSSTGRVVTVSIDKMSFINPIKVGSVVSTYAEMKHFGTSSMQVAVETWVYSYYEREEKIVTSGVFTYVAINNEGKPIRITKPEDIVSIDAS